jgi:hypothetical protein
VTARGARGFAQGLQAAGAALERALSLDPTDPETCRVQLILAWVEVVDADPDEVLERAVASDPEHLGVHLQQLRAFALERSEPAMSRRRTSDLAFGVQRPPETRIAAEARHCEVPLAEELACSAPGDGLASVTAFTSRASGCPSPGLRPRCAAAWHRCEGRLRAEAWFRGAA